MEKDDALMLNSGQNTDRKLCSQIASYKKEEKKKYKHEIHLVLSELH